MSAPYAKWESYDQSQYPSIYEKISPFSEARPTRFNPQIAEPSIMTSKKQKNSFEREHYNVLRAHVNVFLLKKKNRCRHLENY